MPSCLASSHRTAVADTSGDDLLGWAALLAGLAHCRLETLVLAATGLGPAALKLLAPLFAPGGRSRGPSVILHCHFRAYRIWCSPYEI